MNNVLLMLHKVTPQKSVYLGSGIESHSWAPEPQVRLGRRDPGLYCWKDLNMKCAASGFECGTTEGYVQGTFQLLDPGAIGLRPWELLDHWGGALPFASGSSQSWDSAQLYLVLI